MVAPASRLGAPSVAAAAARAGGSADPARRSLSTANDTHAHARTHTHTHRERERGGGREAFFREAGMMVLAGAAQSGGEAWRGISNQS